MDGFGSKKSMVQRDKRVARRDWDRVNFGRVLCKLRSQAGLSQEQLGVRMGRDRRRVMVLEQAKQQESRARAKSHCWQRCSAYPTPRNTSAPPCVPTDTDDHGQMTVASVCARS